MIFIEPHVPSTAFDDPAMPKGVQRVLSVGEYIVERAKQTGWSIERIEPGPLKFIGQWLQATLTWRRAGAT